MNSVASRCGLSGIGKEKWTKTAAAFRGLPRPGRGIKAGYNEIRFEDQAAKEQIYIHGQKNQDIIINGRSAVRQGDPLLLHGCGNCPPHPRTIAEGSSTVIFNGKRAARVSDGIGCGGSISTGSGDVIIGDQRLKMPDQPCLEAAKAAGAAFVRVYPQNPVESDPMVPATGLLERLANAQQLTKTNGHPSVH